MATIASDLPLRILHLEDSAQDHELACIALRRAGALCTLQQVDTLTAFQKVIETDVFDVILADYRLPGFTALDAWALLKPHPRHPPFVLLSGAIGETAAVEAMRQGIADYLLKDDMGRLFHVIARALEVHEARRATEQANAELAASQKRLAELTEHLQSSIEQERAAIAREIHDDIGGALTAMRFDIAWIGRHAVNTAMQEHVTAAVEMLQHALGASQRIMMNLRPPVLEQGLVAAVQWLASGFEHRTGVSIQIDSTSETIPVSADIQLVAYRTAQEALTNAAKYAQATAIRIELSDHEGFLTLEIKDDGHGMQPDMLTKPRAFGLKGLQERARTVGGWLDISSQPGCGTSITLSVPLALSEPHS